MSIPAIPAAVGNALFQLNTLILKVEKNFKSMPVCAFAALPVVPPIILSTLSGFSSVASTAKARSFFLSLVKKESLNLTNSICVQNKTIPGIVKIPLLILPYAKSSLVTAKKQLELPTHAAVIITSFSTASTGASI